MKTVDNAGLILRKSWTVKLSVLAAGLEALGLAWPLIEPHVQVLVNPNVFRVLAVVALAAIPIARVIKQSNLP